MDYTPASQPADQWWAACFPQHTNRRDEKMTTPQGRPSVSPSPRNLGESLQDPSLASTQANAQGGGQYSGSGEARPKIVGDYMEDVNSRSTEGATVADDQSQENVTAQRGPQPDVL